MKSVTVAFFFVVVFVCWCASGYTDNVSGQATVAVDVSLPVKVPGTQIDHLSAQLLTPPTRKVLWQVGRLDGRPERADSPFTGEFGKETVSGAIVRIDAGRVREDFPQRIVPGQTIVLDLPEMEAQDLLFRAASVRWDEPDAMDDPTKAAPSLRILYNQKIIWGRRTSCHGFMINALIPASFQNSHNHTVTLQNIGKIDVVFDALWIESARGASDTVQFAIRDWDRIPDDYKGEFGWNQEREGKRMPGIPSSRDALLGYPMKRFEAALRRNDKVEASCEGSWHYRNLFVAFNEQEKVALYFLERAVGWYFHGGSALTIENVTGPGRFFCPYTNRKYPSAFALSAVSRVFEGDARRLPVNVLAGGGNERPLDLVYWLATENKPGVASIIIARGRFGSTPGGKVRVVCALPWQGATVANIYNGIFPEDVFLEKPTYRGEFIGDVRVDDPNGPYERHRMDKVMNIKLAPNGQGGLLDVELDIQDCLYIRLVKDGVEPIDRPAVNPGVVARPIKKPVAINVAVAASESRESSHRLRKRVPIYPGVMQHLSPNYRVRIGEATRRTMAGQDDVAPADAQSLFCDIDYAFGKALTAEGAVLRLYGFQENIAGRHLSFWVYPHTKTAGNPVTLRMGLGAWEGSVMLEPGKWQRVELHFADIASEPERHLVLLGPVFDDRPGLTDAITFEFNGIKLLDAVVNSTLVLPFAQTGAAASLYPVSEPSGTVEIEGPDQVARQRDISKFGEGFVDYRDARTLHLDNAYQAAILQYNALVERHAGTVYAEAAKFYRAQCLAATGEPEKAIDALESFIRASPQGLYRGEALYEIGRLLLEQGDIDKAEEHFNQALSWIVNVRVQDGDLKLPAVPDQAAGMTAPPAAAQTMVNDDLQLATITPAMVINRRTAPWYLTRLEWDSRYYLGFIAFYREKYDEALAQFTKAFEINKALQEKHKKTLGSLHRRLQIACRVKFFLARPAELVTLAQQEKLRFMLADFHALWEKWDLADPVYREFVSSPGSSREARACALRALGEAEQHQGRWEEAKKYFHKIVDEYGQTPSAQRAMLTLGLESRATVEQRAERLKKAHEMDPNSEDGERALWQLGFMYYAEKRPKESLEALAQFIRRYPQSRFMGHAKLFIEEQQP